MNPLEEKAPRTKRPVQVALFKTVLEPFGSHGSSIDLLRESSLTLNPSPKFGRGTLKLAPLLPARWSRSPLLTNIALHSLKPAVLIAFPQSKKVCGKTQNCEPQMILCAGDSVILHPDKSIVVVSPIEILPDAI